MHPLKLRKSLLLFVSLLSVGFSLPAFSAPAYGVDRAGLQKLESAPAPQNGFTYTRLQHGVQLRVGDQVKNVMFYGPGIVRVNTTLGEVHTEQPSITVVAKPPVPKFDVEDAEGSLRIVSPELVVVVEKTSGALSFLRPDGTVISRENAGRPVTLEEVEIAGEPTYEVRQTFTLDDGESLYGLGQYNDPYMDYRGQKVLLVQTNIGIVVPFLISTNRYGIMWDVCSKTVFEDGESGASWWSESAPAGADYYFIAGDDMDGVIEGYRHLTGAAPMFPKAAFGLFMSKERYPTQDRLVEVVENFRRDGFPLDYIVQDWQYWGGGTWGGEWDGKWSGMVWDEERFPDPAAAIEKLHEDLHVKVMISIWPSVGNDTELARDLDAKGLRFEPLHWISKKARIYDAFSEEGRRIYFDHIKRGLLDKGIDALWMDGTEVEVGSACHDPAKVEADIKSLGDNAMGDFTRYLNCYTLLTTKGTYEGQRSLGDKRVLTLTRSAWAGQQRYAALSWSGDTRANWETLRQQISGGLNVCMAGQPYWTQDVGGFFAPGNGHQDPAYLELFARWNQFGIFNPVYRIHGTGPEREPYRFRKSDPEIYQSLLKAVHLRYRLLPYLYSLGWASTAEGYTMMRALPMDFPDQTALRKIDDQFMFGPAFLVHPVTRAMHRVGAPPPPTIPAEFLMTPEGRPGLAAEYFHGRDFNRSAGKRVEEKLEHTWPGPPLEDWPVDLAGGNEFSGRWEGSLVAPESGTYEIGVEADDGFRLWLDGKKVVEDWRDRAKLYRGAKVDLQKGEKLPLKIEYYQGDHDRSLRLAWKTPSELAKGENGSVYEMETLLPDGSDWYDFWTNERHEGGGIVAREVPLDILPVYVRAGSIVPMGPVMQWATEKPGAPYEIRVYPGADASFTLYEDDNETYAYEKGERATIEMEWNDVDRILTIGQRKGSFPQLVKNREFRIVIARPERGADISEAKADRVVNYRGTEKVVRF